jgi:hypothetical protein
MITVVAMLVTEANMSKYSTLEEYIDNALCLS